VTDRLLTVPEVCERTSLGKTLVYEMIKRGEIRALKAGRVLRVRESALQPWMDEREVATMGEYGHVL